MEQQKQQFFILWLTGFPAAGKTTIGKIVYKELKNRGYKIHHLDGDGFRAAFQEKLGFSPEDRDKNINLAIDLAKKYQDKGYIIIASFFSPYKRHREWGREKFNNYIEVFVNSPLAVCEARDSKGIYKKARAGEMEYFTSISAISDIYEEPDNPEIELKTNLKSVEECVEEVMEYLKKSGLI